MKTESLFGFREIQQRNVLYNDCAYYKENKSSVFDISS